MILSTISSNLVHEARQFSAENQTRRTRERTATTTSTTETRNRSQDLSSAQRVPTVAEYLAPNDPDVQRQLTSLAPALNARVEGRLREALDLTEDFRQSRSIVEPALASYSQTIRATGNRVVSRQTTSASLGLDFRSSLLQLAGIVGGQNSPYTTVEPDPRILTTGIESGDYFVNRLL